MGSINDELVSACSFEDLPEGHIQYLVLKGADVDTMDGLPLKLSIERMRVETIKFLLQNGAKISQNHLITAFVDSNIEILKILFAEKISPEIIKENGNEILEEWVDCYEQFELLLPFYSLEEIKNLEKTPVVKKYLHKINSNEIRMKMNQYFNK